MITPLPGETATKPGSATRPFPGIDAEVYDEHGQDRDARPHGGFLVLEKPVARHAARHLGRPEALPRAVLEPLRRTSTSPATARTATSDGYFWIMGRIDDVMNVSGHRIGTMEVESALVSHPRRRRGRRGGPARRPHGHRDRRLRHAARRAPPPAIALREALLRPRGEADRADREARRRSASPTRCPRRARARSCAACCATSPRARSTVGDTTHARGLQRARAAARGGRGLGGLPRSSAPDLNSARSRVLTINGSQIGNPQGSLSSNRYASDLSLFCDIDHNILTWLVLGWPQIGMDERGDGGEPMQPRHLCFAVLLAFTGSHTAHAQLTDRTQTPNGEKEGIVKIARGAGRRGTRQREHAGFVAATSSRAIRSARSGAAGSCSSGSSRRAGLRVRAPTTASAATSNGDRRRSAPVSSTPAPPATAARAARPDSAATSSRVRTAATRRTCSASACRRCSATR